MTTKRTYLISGANRGIGRGLAAVLLLRPNTVIIAGVRDPQSTSFSDLPKGEGSSIIIVKLESRSENDPVRLVQAIQSAFHDVENIDIVIANAAISHSFAPVSKMRAEDLRDHFEVNVLGPLRLFQATLPLLQKSNAPIFLMVSSRLGSLGEMEDFLYPVGPYGPAKAMSNYLTRKMHFENKELTAFTICPGWVRTDMGRQAGVAFGIPGEPTTTLEESVAGIIDRIDTATRETAGGRFLSFDGSEVKW